jgi:predicted HNH restriction endonuclease
MKQCFLRFPYLLQSHSEKRTLQNTRKAYLDFGLWKGTFFWESCLQARQGLDAAGSVTGRVNRRIQGNITDRSACAQRFGVRHHRCRFLPAEALPAQER